MKKVIVGLVMICAMIFTIGCNKKDPEAKDCKKMNEALAECSFLTKDIQDYDDWYSCLNNNPSAVFQYNHETFRRYSELQDCLYYWKGMNTTMQMMWPVDEYCEGEYSQCGM